MTRKLGVSIARTAVLTSATLGVPGGLSAQEDHGAAWDTLFAVDPGLMFWTVATFLVLLFVLSRFAWKPLLGALDARETRIWENI